MVRNKFVEGQFGLLEPASDWKPFVGELPALSGHLIAIDCETRDNGLANDLGPGWGLGMGYVAGVSVAWETEAIYVPINHPDSECRSKESVVAWLQHLWDNNHVVFHGMPYDTGWLQDTGVKGWPKKWDDTHAMAVMIDENEFSYSLENCCTRNGIEGKDETLLREACANLGIDPKQSRANLWRLPAKFVGPYAEQDARATLNLYKKLLIQITEQKLEKAYRLEADLIPMTVDMRRRGIRIDLDIAEQAQITVRGKRDEALKEIGRMAGRRVAMEDINSPGMMATVFDKLGIEYPKTAKTGMPSFNKIFLEHLDHPIGKLIREARKNHDLSEKFIGTYIMEYQHRGRIHAEIHQLRDDDGGTRSYRFSYSNPPLQQMPSRDPFLGPLTRSIFQPEQGQLWGALDYSQQEPRLAVHYASVAGRTGSDDAVRYYRERTDADFHQMVADMANIARGDAKIINLGLMYGMGLVKLALSLGLSVEEAEILLEKYHTNVPWVRGLTEFCTNRAKSRGYITLIDGARCRFDRWQPVRGQRGVAYTRERAVELFPGQRLERAFAHKAFNRLVQGSAARQTKKAMLECYRRGHLPLLQMHDELDFSFGTEREGVECADVMRHIIPLRVPVKVDAEYGTHWGNAKYNWEDALKKAA